MRNRNFRALLIGVAALALSACGGGGGATSGIAPMPLPPSPAPAQPPALIPAATQSQQFAVLGASHLQVGDQTPQLGDSEQLQVRYVASSNSYEVQLPESQTWSAIEYTPAGDGTPINFTGGGAHLWLRSDGYQYSRLVEWSGGNSLHGYEAIGIATLAGGVPTTGSASYSGQIMGFTSETHSADDLFISGSIAMNFNFGSGSLFGSISPILNQDFTQHFLGTIDFRNTVYSAGSTTFAGEFDTDIPGLNSFGGLFTGPNAQELIGNFALPYRSPIDGTDQQAAGAFVGRAD
jgi:hypothetical protein